MNFKRVGCMVLVLAVTSVAWVQAAEDAQAKALRQQIEGEIAARKAEADALIAADIAKNPNGANAQAAKKAAAEAKALEQMKQTAEEKTKADLDEAAKVAADKAEEDRKAAAAAWEAGAADRARLEKEKQAAVEKWRKSGKSGPSILLGRSADGAYTVMVDGKVSTFPTEEEAKAFAIKTRDKADGTLTY